MQPQEIELAFIGSLVNGRDEVKVAIEQGIDSEYFSSFQARKIFEISKELYNENKDIDITLIGTKATPKEQDCIFQYLVEATSKVETPHTKEFALKLTEAHQKRKKVRAPLPKKPRMRFRLKRLPLLSKMTEKAKRRTQRSIWNLLALQDPDIRFCPTFFMGWLCL